MRYVLIKVNGAGRGEAEETCGTRPVDRRAVISVDASHVEGGRRGKDDCPFKVAAMSTLSPPN